MDKKRINHWDKNIICLNEGEKKEEHGLGKIYVKKTPCNFIFLNTRISNSVFHSLHYQSISTPYCLKQIRHYFHFLVSKRFFSCLSSFLNFLVTFSSNILVAVLKPLILKIYPSINYFLKINVHAYYLMIRFEALWCFMIHPVACMCMRFHTICYTLRHPFWCKQNYFYHFIRKTIYTRRVLMDNRYPTEKILRWVLWYRYPVTIMDFWISGIYINIFFIYQKYR